MAVVQIRDEQLAQRLSELAERENRTIDDLVRTWLDQYVHREQSLAAMEGMFDDDVSDLSTSVRETMSNFYQRRDDRSG
ncbi:MAG: hypothetical protein L6Q98_24330 [Anaerolineae bacterium]|nr:hypothetical protein [Anaerolineae bacterium]NUQ06867.1 hypothetical protein [Anaerolineae bacterium]